MTHRPLNPEQHKAVCCTHGRVLVLAGAGSGKTLVLTRRIAHLIQQGHAKPEQILGLTFTNKAAAEMKERLALLLDQKSASQVVLCTFHSFCMAVLRKEIHHLGYTRQFSLYDSYDVQRLALQITRDLLEHNSELPSINTTMSAIAQAKNQGLTSDQLKADHTWHDKFTKELFDRLESCMKAYNAVDFDHLLFLTLKLFKQHPDVLKCYQDRFLHLLIDEYQDTNPVQYEIASLLTQQSRNLCVVGDDDQSIYGWRGADVSHILEFQGDHVVKLEQNYRSTNIILQAANTLIAHNKDRHDKKLWSAQTEGPLIEIFHAPSEREEASAVIGRLVALKEREKLKWQDFAILYRSNAQYEPIEQELLRHTWKNGDRWIQGIPYQIYGGQEYYERREVKDVLAYLRVLLNPLDQEALLRIINLPRRGIGDETLDKLTTLNRQKNCSLWQTINEQMDHNGLQLASKTIQSLQKFVHLIERAKEKFQKLTLTDATQWLLEECHFKVAIQEEVKSEKMRDFKWQNVMQLVSSIGEYEERKREQNLAEEISLHDFVTSTPLGKEQIHHSNNEGRLDKVSLMTFHSAKGLEFTACFLVGLEDHIIPHEKSLAQTGVEEERRLMYVAITRAKQHLFCSMAQRRQRLGKETASKPSRFLHELPKELLNITDYKQITC